MRQYRSTITPSVVRATAGAALKKALPVKDYGRKVTAGCLLDLLLLVAAVGSSLSAIVRRFRFGFSHETARQAVAANMPGLEQLTENLLDAFYLFGSRIWRKRTWDVAIDLHYSPFYGDRATPGVVGGQKKHGSKHHYAYASAVLIHRRHRYCVGLLPVDKKRKPHEIVAALLEQMTKRGLKLRGVVLDSGFASGDTILLLQDKELAYTVPLPKKGKGNNRRNACFLLPVGTVSETEWVTEKSRKAVKTSIVVLRRPKEKDVKVYAFGGWGAAEEARVRQRARLAKMAYRRRFGIETSYRQMNEGKAKTTKKDVAYRLLLVGLALLLRQVWVWLTWQVARALQLKPKQWVGLLPLATMLAWLADLLKDYYGEDKSIPLGRPILPLDIGLAA
jgi:Transposase DDE domain